MLRTVEGKCTTLEKYNTQLLLKEQVILQLVTITDN